MLKVSVVLSTFNRCDLLKPAIESVRAQSFQDWELIVIDDGSKDGTKEMIQSYFGTDSRIRYFFQSNKGISFSRARGTKLAVGQYVSFLDDDDAYVPEKLEQQVDFLEKNPKVGLVYSYVNVIDQKEHCFMRWPILPAESFFQLLTDNTIPTNSGLIRKKCFDEIGVFREDFKGSDDYEMWLRISKSYPIKFLPMVAGTYRWHENNMSYNKRKRCSNDLEVFRAVMHYELSKVETKKVIQRVIELTYTKGSDALTNKIYSDAAFYFAHAIRFNLFIGLYISWGRSFNWFYQLFRPYAAFLYATLNTGVLFFRNLILREQLSNV